MHFGSSEGNRGLKYGRCLRYGMDIFWNRPVGFIGLKKSIRSCVTQFSQIRKLKMPVKLRET